MTSIPDRASRIVKGVYSEFDRFETLSKLTSLSLKEKTDGSFFKVGVSLVVDSEKLAPDEPEIFGLERYGSATANSEVGLLVDQLLKQHEIKKLPATNALVRTQLAYLDNLHQLSSDYVVLSSFEWENEFISNNFFGAIWDSIQKRFILQIGNWQVPVFTYPKEIVGNRIILLDSKSVETNYIQKLNPITGHNSRLLIDVHPHGPEMIFEIRTTLKFNFRNMDMNSIFSMEYT